VCIPNQKSIVASKDIALGILDYALYGDIYEMNKELFIDWDAAERLAKVATISTPSKGIHEKLISVDEDGSFRIDLESKDDHPLLRVLFGPTWKEYVSLMRQVGNRSISFLSPNDGYISMFNHPFVRLLWFHSLSYGSVLDFDTRIILHYCSRLWGSQEGPRDDYFRG